MSWESNIKDLEGLLLEMRMLGALARTERYDLPKGFREELERDTEDLADRLQDAIHRLGGAVPS